MNKPIAPAGSLSNVGIVLALLGTICFSTKAVMVKLAYGLDDIDSISLLALRMAFSLPFFLGIAFWNSRRESEARREPLGRADWFKVALVGITGYYLASYLDFLGLQFLTAGMERLILFIYPTLVLLLSAALLGKPIERGQVIALLLTYLGIGLAFIEAVELDTTGRFWLGAGLVFASALAYALYLMGSGELIPRLGSVRFTAFAMIAAAVAVLLQAYLANGLAIFGFRPGIYGLAFLIAVVATVLPVFLVAEGIRRIGAANVAIIGSISPFATVVLEYFFLGETFGPFQWLGAVLVVIGVLLLKKPRRLPLYVRRHFARAEKMQ